MKIHDLHPAEGSVTKRTRVGRGIAAGKGKTAGRGTKGQKSRAGASIPAWFEGGQTPLHIRIPKLRGFRNINDVEYEVVNVGAISAAVDAGKLEVQKGAPVTVNADTLKQAGLVRRDRLPLKILGEGEVGTKLFVLADAFTRSAREKIEAAGGTAQLIEIPTSPLAALGVDVPADADAGKPARGKRAKAGAADTDAGEPVAATSDKAAEATADDAPEATAEAKPSKGRAKAAAAEADTAEAAPADEAEPAAEAPAATAEPAAEAGAPEDATEPGTPAEADEADAGDNG
jgi:large subunit ribosomal protein L15